MSHSFIYKLMVYNYDVFERKCMILFMRKIDT